MAGLTAPAYWGDPKRLPKLDQASRPVVALLARRRLPFSGATVELPLGTRFNANLTRICVGLVGPLPPPSGGMANQTLQLSRLLTGDGLAVEIVQVNAPYSPSWAGRLPVIRAAFRLGPYLARLWRAAGRNDLLHVMANSGWSWHLFAAPAIWVARLRGTPVVVNYRGGEAERFLQRAGAVVRFSMRRASALVVPSGFLSTPVRSQVARSRGTQSFSNGSQR